MSDLAVVMREQARGMVTLRGDLTSFAVKRAIKAACGQAVPTAGRILGDVVRGVAWMSPDEVLLFVPYPEVGSTLAAIDKTLSKNHYLAVDVSDARVTFRVTGEAANDVLARLCPVDLHRDSFGVGQFRRTRMAQVAAAIWRHETGFNVVCFRSVAGYVDTILRNAATARKTGAL